MTIHEQTIRKIRELPESPVQEVDDFVDFLLSKWRREQPQESPETIEPFRVAGSDMADYLRNLEDYEARLERGEIRW